MTEQTRRRAPRGPGTRTTLRVPEDLARVAQQLAGDLDISRNDALLRLATQGARILEQEQQITQQRALRWAAIVPGETGVASTELPSADEARAAVLAHREGTGDESG